MAEGGSEDQGDKTEAPTPRRLEKAREEGQVPLSREAVNLAALFGGMLAISMVIPATGNDLIVGLRGILAGIGGLQPLAAAGEAAWLSLSVVLPIALVVAVCAAGATLLQTGFLISPKSLKPKLGKLNPIAGVKRLVGIEGMIEFGRAILKLLVVGGAIFVAFGDPFEFERSLQISPNALANSLWSGTMGMATAALSALTILAAADILLVRVRHTRKLRMSRQDLKEEGKEAEGDPLIKARIAAIRRQRARRRIMQAVPKATVVVTNPTHYAVALAYDRAAGGAPKVVAKGADAMAARIREVAQKHGVPVVPNPPLARALYKLPEDSEVTPEQYKAVAEIIAYVMRLRDGRRAAGGSPAA